MVRSSQAAWRMGACLALFALGCAKAPEPLHSLQDPPGPPPPLATHFDPQATGAIRGHVVWLGAKPVSHAYRDANVAVASDADSIDHINPLLPRVAGPGDGVAAAIVFLRRVDADRSKPWDLSPVEIVMSDELIHIEQGGRQALTGIVHTGDDVVMASTSPKLEMLRAQGPAFFTLPFPEPDKPPLRRRLPTAGIVELTSAVGHLLARSWLIVADHPYVVRSGDDGSFHLSQVPEGDYELVCWLPNWNIDHYERDLENLYVTRLWLMPALEKSVPIKVRRGEVAAATFPIADCDFTRKMVPRGQE